MSQWSESTLSISYNLSPPLGSESANLSASKTQAFKVNGTQADGQKKYYEALKETIADARNKVGNELTTWRDIVGNLELNKETKKKSKWEEGGEEDEEDEEDEE